MKKINGIIMQYFEWYMDCKQNLWNQIKENAEKLSEMGITAMWLGHRKPQKCAGKRAGNRAGKK